MPACRGGGSRSSELFVLAIASAFWPVLLVVVLVSLRAHRPVRLLVSFLAGGLLTTMVVGLVIIYALEGSSLSGHSKQTFEPWVKVTAGSLALLAARRSVEVAPATGGQARPGERRRPAQQVGAHARARRAARIRGGDHLRPLSGVFPLVALADIAARDISFLATVGLLLGFYLIMFAFIEVPLVCYLVAPERTGLATARFNAWGRRQRPPGWPSAARSACSAST